MPTKEELKQVFVTGAIPTQQNFHDLIDVAGEQGVKGDPGAKGNPGKDGIGVVGVTSDGTNITFTLSDGNTIAVPWPNQG